MDLGRLLQTRERKDIISVPPRATVREAVRTLALHRIGALPIVEDDRVLGIFSERDMIYCLGDGDGMGEACLGKDVASVMTAPAITVERGTSVLDALALMSRRRIRHLPVVDGERLVGFVSIGDLVQARLEEIQYEADTMREYIRMA